MAFRNPIFGTRSVLCSCAPVKRLVLGLGLRLGLRLELGLELGLGWELGLELDVRVRARVRGEFGLELSLGLGLRRSCPVEGLVSFPRSNHSLIAACSYVCPSSVVTGLIITASVMGHLNEGKGSVAMFDPEARLSRIQVNYGKMAVVN